MGWKRAGAKAEPFVSRGQGFADSGGDGLLVGSCEFRKRKGIQVLNSSLDWSPMFEFTLFLEQ